MVVIWNELFYSRQWRRLVTSIDTHYNVRGAGSVGGAGGKGSSAASPRGRL